MAELVERDTRLIQDTLTKSWKHNAFHAGFQALFIAYLVWKRAPASTTWGKVQIALFVIAGLGLVAYVRAVFRLRAGGAVARTLLEQPADLVSAKGWPGVKPPDGKWPAYVRIVTKGGGLGTLKVEAPRMKSLVEALKRRSPDAEVFVHNIVIEPAAPAQEPVAP